MSIESSKTYHNNTKNCTYYESEDSDSGLVADASDVLPDEEDLSLPTGLDYEDLLHDLTFEDCNDSCFEEEEYLNEVSEESEVDFTHNDNNSFCEFKNGGSNILHDDNINNAEEVDKEEESPKLKAFSREQARNWRKKRILNSTTKTNVNKNLVKCPVSLEPLLPLPEKLKPITKNERNKKLLTKLLDPLQGGEKIKNTRGPQPMKLRALPESFWKEPNSLDNSSLARNNYSVVPPIFSAESSNNTTEAMDDVRPVTPPNGKSQSPRHSPRHKKKMTASTNPNTGLLFSLFDHLENTVDRRLIVRRGRPKKTLIERIPPPPRKICDGDDPCIVDDLADKWFPELSLSSKQSQEKNSNFAIVRISKGESILEFSAVQAEQNYCAILNELVSHM